jgi:hypothetical protein
MVHLLHAGVYDLCCKLFCLAAAKGLLVARHILPAVVDDPGIVLDHAVAEIVRIDADKHHLRSRGLTKLMCTVQACWGRLACGDHANHRIV